MLLEYSWRDIALRPDDSASIIGMPSIPPTEVRFMEALRFWFKLGFISFGGPAGQIAIMHQELVEKRRWISERRFLHALNYCMVLPGPEALQLTIYIGWLLHRAPGGIIAGTLFILPSLFILIGLSWVYLAYGHLPLIAGIFYGIKPAVTAIVFQATHRIGSRVLNNRWLWGIAITAFLALFVFNIPFPIIIACAAATGYIGGIYRAAGFQAATHTARAPTLCGPALIDDGTPPPAHARFSWARVWHIGLAGTLLWSIPIAALVARYGWHGLYTEMGIFFSKAALLTFGGAYAVLPYVYQGAVEHYGWLSAGQMIDGLGLGETTPGPLIIVVAFVGFVGGYLRDATTGFQPFISGTLAALIVTWFTFLPSFLFILLGGPLVESTRGNLKLTAPLTAISAAVVGVIFNLALFFGYHTLWPRDSGGSFDAVALAICIAALVALFRFKWNVLSVIAGAAVTGCMLQLLS